MQSNSTAKYRKDIQGLRALAVVMVIIFHLNHNWLPGGFVGVDVFFAISGYLISGIIMRQVQRGTFSYFDFMVNNFYGISKYADTAGDRLGDLVTNLKQGQNGK